MEPLLWLRPDPASDDMAFCLTKRPGDANHDILAADTGSSRYHALRCGEDDHACPGTPVEELRRTVRSSGCKACNRKTLRGEDEREIPAFTGFSLNCKIVVSALCSPETRTPRCVPRTSRRSATLPRLPASTAPVRPSPSALRRVRPVRGQTCLPPAPCRGDLGVAVQCPTTLTSGPDLQRVSARSHHHRNQSAIAPEGHRRHDFRLFQGRRLAPEPEK